MLYNLKECEKMSNEHARTRVIICLVKELPSFSDVLTSTFIAVFDMQYLKVQVGSKKFLQQFGSGVRIVHSYQIYLNKLVCF